MIDSTEFWLSFAAWIALGAVLIGTGARAIFVLIRAARVRPAKL